MTDDYTYTDLALEKKEARLLFPASFPSYQPSYLAQY